MELATLLDKTKKGRAEIRDGKYKLPAKLRLLLILVDGLHEAGSLRQQARKIGLREESLNDLYAGGFIAETGSASTIPSAAEKSTSATSQASDPGNLYERYRNARQFMNETIVNATGFKSFFFTLKIEKTATLEDLRGLLGDYATAMSKALGAETAELFITRMRRLLV